MLGAHPPVWLRSPLRAPIWPRFPAAGCRGGTVTQLDATLGGSGLAQLESLLARHVHMAVADSGLIRVTATASLNAAVTGSGVMINPRQSAGNQERDRNTWMSGAGRPGKCLPDDEQRRPAGLGTSGVPGQGHSALKES